MKPMSTLKFMKKKNKILKKLTGIKLIPKNQLKEIETIKLKIQIEKWNTDTLICPYCFIYDNCEGCPMNRTNNCKDDTSTYRQVIDRLNTYILHEPRIQKLVNKFNKSNGFT